MSRQAYGERMNMTDELRMLQQQRHSRANGNNANNSNNNNNSTEGSNPAYNMSNVNNNSPAYNTNEGTVASIPPPYQQAAASAPPVASEEGEKWNCKHCTYENPHHFIKCEMCHQPGENRPPPPRQEPVAIPIYQPANQVYQPAYSGANNNNSDNRRNNNRGRGQSNSNSVARRGRYNNGYQ
eukprot:UN24579